MVNEDLIITAVIKEVGISPGILGYNYIADAMHMLLDEPCMLQQVVHGVYPAVAAMHHVTAQSVERCIRHAIGSSYNRLPPKVIYKVFGNAAPTNGKVPTNKVYLAALHTYVVEQLIIAKEAIV